MSLGAGLGPATSPRGPGVEIVVVDVGLQGLLIRQLVVVANFKQDAELFEASRDGTPELLKVLLEVPLEGYPVALLGVFTGEEDELSVTDGERLLVDAGEDVA